MVGPAEISAASVRILDMVIQIRLSDRTDHTPEQIRMDSLGRSWCGYDPGVNDEELWEHNRGRWLLAEARIADESFATFVYGGRTVAVYELHGYERVSDPGPAESKIALIGTALDTTHPVYRRLVNQPANHVGRNAVNYVPDAAIGEAELGAETGRRAFLLTWNPDHWDWDDFSQSAQETDGVGWHDGRWATGSRVRGIHPGDLVFLLRQGKRERGIVGCGQAVDFSETAGPDDEIIYSDSHWDGTGATANYVDVRWDRLIEPANALPISALKEQFPTQNWSPMGSGTAIRAELVDDVHARWSAHIGQVEDGAGGQGVQVDVARRKAVEDAAQDWLMRHYEADGWEVRDTRFSGPYDAVATKDGETVYLEAKGTQGSDGAVLLTRGEVEHARRNRGNCVIGIWSGIRFTADDEVDQTSGSTLIMPFEPDTGTLTALQYRWEFGVFE